MQVGVIMQKAAGTIAIPELTIPIFPLPPPPSRHCGIPRPPNPSSRVFRVLFFLFPGWRHFAFVTILHSKYPSSLSIGFPKLINRKLQNKAYRIGNVIKIIAIK